MDRSTFGGLSLATVGILAGLAIEGGRVSQILQPTAAMIVFGGTVGAVMVQFPLPVINEAAKRLRSLFLESETDVRLKIQQIVDYAVTARRLGLVSLDKTLDSIKDPFLKRALMLAVDGTDPEQLRAIMQRELDSMAETEEHVPHVYESAGGFAPTIGIIGAILGLIQVMQHLQNIDEVGKGIAVAFVATIYGVASANLFFLPAAGKIAMRLREEQIHREMILEGVVSIVDGTNPRLIELKLLSFLHDRTKTSEADEK